MKIKKCFKRAYEKGLNVVVSSRVVAGRVAVSDSDEKLGFISAEDLNPQKQEFYLC